MLVQIYYSGPDQREDALKCRAKVSEILDSANEVYQCSEEDVMQDDKVVDRIFTSQHKVMDPLFVAIYPGCARELRRIRAAGEEMVKMLERVVGEHRVVLEIIVA